MLSAKPRKNILVQRGLTQKHDLTSDNEDLMFFLQTLLCNVAKLSPNVDQIWNSGTVKHLNKPIAFTVKYNLSSKLQSCSRVH